MTPVLEALCRVEADSSYLTWLATKALADDKPTHYTAARLSLMELQAGRVVQAVSNLKDVLDAVERARDAR